MSQVHGRREENGFILAVSLLFFPEKKILRKPPLVISHGQKCVTWSFLSVRKAVKLWSIWLFSDPILEGSKGKKGLRINVSWIGQHRVSAALTFLLCTSQHVVEFSSHELT